MNLVAIIVFLFHVKVNSKESEEIFNYNVDKIFKSVIGREADYVQETTHAFPDIPDEEFFNFTKHKRKHSQTFLYKNKTAIKHFLTLKNSTNKNEKVTANHTMKNKVNSTEDENPFKTINDIENRMRALEIERILANDLNPLPNFDKDEDDTALITRRFDKLKKEFEIGDSRRRERQVKSRNIIRNRTISIMDHFIYATRYKLPYSQILRAKYRDSENYRIGYCFGLLYQLKRQQILMYTELSLHQFNIEHLHLHMKLYEKVVRLDVDIKDTMRLIRQYEAKRRVREDPNYYDIYEEEQTARTPGRLGI
ncbi:unnamed protein product [Diatraea saccharalis]|uniref:Uncharacterized protein n=1 Tax=Diatraea saccharalis TaxID=40085 RepID=A0A9N9RDF3_9NEOP|nr:unnamed protein product [Diatraea saccharalis]